MNNKPLTINGAFILIPLVKIYQFYISKIFDVAVGYKHTCRYSPTCSEYAVDEIKKNGIFALPRVTRHLLSCHPFTK